MPQAVFEREIARLDADIPSLADHQVIVRLQQIAAAVGDGHTRVQLPSTFKRYPLDEDADAVVPDKQLPPSWDDFRAGRDGVMAWILRTPAG